MKILLNVLSKIKSVSKPTQKFLVAIAKSMIGTMGKKNMGNMARYSDLDEHTFARQMVKKVDFPEINCELIQSQITDQTVLIVAQDTTITLKSGKKTEGVGLIWNSSASHPDKGLEIDAISIVAVGQKNIGYPLQYCEQFYIPIWDFIHQK
jgi:hypothetical protein